MAVGLSATKAIIAICNFSYAGKDLENERKKRENRPFFLPKTTQQRRWFIRQRMAELPDELLVVVLKHV